MNTLPKVTSNWRIFDLLKQKKPPPSPSLSPKAPHVYKCVCCQTVVTFPGHTAKFKCAVCHTTNEFHAIAASHVHPLSHKYLRKLVDTCVKEQAPELGHPRALSKLLHEVFEPLVAYLDHAMTAACLNHSFKINKKWARPHYTSSNIDTVDVRQTFHLLTKLPTKRPLFQALTRASASLQHVDVDLVSDPMQLHWVLVLLEIPFLLHALTHSTTSAMPKAMVDYPEIRALCYDITKRALGILSHTRHHSANNYLASWFSKLPHDDFVHKVDLVNAYITFHLRKYHYIANNSHLARRPSLPHLEYLDDANIKNHIEELAHSPSPLLPVFANGPFPPKKQGPVKIKLHLYGNDWHLHTAAVVLWTFFRANTIRPAKLPISIFYNSLVDFVHIKYDFDLWLARTHPSPGAPPELESVIGYINGQNNLLLDTAAYFLCQYPFLISLGAKISILEYEARRQMERKAEEAFIAALDQRVAVDVYLKIKVRRDHLLHDLLRCIQANPHSLKKSLRVQFVGEPGIDAGGLKKEWFLLLTKELFSPSVGMVHNVDSNFLWFSLTSRDISESLYLFGAVLGLAIYNSTILDLNFPMALYKLLAGHHVGLADYQEVFPEAAHNLFKLRDYTASQLEQLDLTFEVLYKDGITDEIRHQELVPGGSRLVVSVDNRERYIDKYAQFFLGDGMRLQLAHFQKGFSSVIAGNALLLFSPDEIQLLLCGSEQSRLDVDILKSITTYRGWTNRAIALQSDIVSWFWEYLEGLSFSQQKQFLAFVTGLDRVPATGIQSMAFKILLHSHHDERRLPVAHTCFNELVLYNYAAKATLHARLHMAVTESSGFGIK